MQSVEDRAMATGNIHQNLVNVIFELCEQTDTQTEVLIAVVRTLLP